jgi:virginiamycin A acetyltransferase
MLRWREYEAKGTPLAADAAPDPMTLHPVAGQPRVVLLKPLITSPLIEVGEFSYYDDPEFADEFETRNVLHHYGPDRLIIGRFCAFAAGTTFIMNGANHRMDGISTSRSRSWEARGPRTSICSRTCRRAATR